MDITREQLEDLLAWLDPNRETAGRKYETIHTGLTRMFISRGFSDAEDLADQTIKRVITLLPKVKDTGYEERAPFFYKVAGYITMEARRRREITVDVSPVVLIAEDTSDIYEYLLKCLKLLSEEKRELILDYHLYQGHDKIKQHERMAREHGISVEALRSRAHHIRKTLKHCVRQGKKPQQKKQKPLWMSLVQRR